MWGGVKARKHYGDHFRQWSATKGLDDLRRLLYQEPRPWYLAFSLHQRQHLLQDQHCARLISWCTTVVQLRETREEKQEAYRFSQETFSMLVHSHKADKDAFFEYLRLCAVGKDLTTAYDWHKYWVETKVREKDEGGAQKTILLQQYACLLRIALESPSDESAEDMAVAVMEGYSDNCCVPMEHGETGARVLAHCEPTSPAEEEALQGLFCGFHALGRRLGLPHSEQTHGEGRSAGTSDAEDSNLAEFVAALPVTESQAQSWVDRGWPVRSHCHNFPQLEAGAKVQESTPAYPRLRDSLLSDRLVEKLEHAAFTQRSAAAVIAVLQWYQKCVTMEREKNDSDTRRLHQQTLDGELLDVWKQFADGTAQRFRAAVVEAGGLTPELYHYVVSALAHIQPSAALRTIQRMRDSNLRILDLTRATALVAAQGAFSAQLELFNEQLEEIAARRKLDEDFDISKRIENYWKYQYTDFFHYMNALDETAFYCFLMEGLQSAGVAGPQAVQELLLASSKYNTTAVMEEDLVVLDDALRLSAAKHFRRRLGQSEVDTAMDIITKHMPKLDVSLVGSLPHFSDYTLKEGDSIATDVGMLANTLKPYDRVYVLDTSFVETSEMFLGLQNHSGAAGSTVKRSLVLIPYVTLAQLGESVSSANRFVTFDSALAEAVAGEPFLASQRLRALYALSQQGMGEGEQSGESPSTRLDVRVLHFTECLLAHSLPRKVVSEELHLSPSTSDNDHLTLVLSLLSSLMKPEARLVLCSDDPSMVKKLIAAERGNNATAPPVVTGLFRTPIEVLRTQPPPSVDVGSGMINDNPTLGFSNDDFVPKMDVSKAIRSPPAADVSPEEEGSEQQSQALALEGGKETRSSSPWLSLLEDEEEPTPAAVAALPVTQSSPMGTTGAQKLLTPEEEAALAEKAEELMSLYATPSDVVPVGVQMQEASSLGSVFAQFDVVEPEEVEQQAQDRQARSSRLQQSGSGPVGKRRRSALERDMLSNRGASFKERQRMAKHLSNMSGGRVPFNLRYKVVEANVRDPRNAKLKRSFEEGVRRKRELFKKSNL